MVGYDWLNYTIDGINSNVGVYSLSVEWTSFDGTNWSAFRPVEANVSMNSSYISLPTFFLKPYSAFPSVSPANLLAINSGNVNQTAMMFNMPASTVHLSNVPVETPMGKLHVSKIIMDDINIGAPYYVLYINRYSGVYVRALWFTGTSDGILNWSLVKTNVPMTETTLNVEPIAALVGGISTAVVVLLIAVWLRRKHTPQ